MISGGLWVWRCRYRYGSRLCIFDFDCVLNCDAVFVFG